MSYVRRNLGLIVNLCERETVKKYLSGRVESASSYEKRGDCMNENLLEIKFYGLQGFRLIRHCVSEYIRKMLRDKPGLMEVALNEAVNNAIEHGKASIKLKLNVIAGKRLVVRVKDQGAGFPGQTLLAKDEKDFEFDESGRGIMIMKASADYVRYNRCGNEVLLVKHIEQEECG